MAEKKQATIRSQFLDYNFIRSGQFSANELALLSIISSFSERCEMNHEYLAKAINKSIPTIRRTIKKLLEKGIIQRTYTVFKRTVLRIISLEAQKKLFTVGGMIKQVLKLGKIKRKNLMKSSERSPMIELKRSPMIEPTRSETEEIKQVNRVNFLKPEFKKETLAEKRDRMIREFKAAYHLK